MDWSDHPEKTQAWYNEREARAIDDGLLHVFRQEVDHNYAACVEGVIIPAEWVKSSIDAHIKLRFEQHPNDDCCAGLDVADGGGDRNALAIREGVTLWAIEQWGERDTGVATRKASMVYKFTGVEVAEYRFSMISWRWLGCQGGV